MSPKDGRDYYVITNRESKILHSVKASTGSEHLQFNLNTDLGNFAASLAWVYDTDLVLVAGYGSTMALYDFMDTSKSRAIVTTTYEGGATQPDNVLIWIDKRAAILAQQATDVSDIYKIPVADQPCSDLCATCHDVFKKQCTTCEPNSSPRGTACFCDDGYYETQIIFTRKQCLICSTLCATCNGGAPTNCLTCKDPNGEVKGDGSCGCKDGYYMSGTTCLPCHSSCRTCSSGDENSCLSCRTSGWFQVGSTCRPCDSSCDACSGPTSNECLSCSEAGFFLKSGSCLSCPSETSADCPSVTSVTLLTKIQEFTRTLELDFSPSLKDQFDRANQASLLTVENLLKNNIKITFGSSDDSQNEITIMSTRMSHLSSNPTGNRRLPDSAVATQSHTYVYINFLQNLRYNSSNYLRLSLRSPWIYKPSSRGEHQNTVYLREGWSQKVTLTPKVSSEEEKTYEWAKWFGKDVTAGIGVIAPVGTIMAFILAWTSNFLGSLIRVFNVANFVANIGKMNVKLVTNVNATYTFVDNIKIPEWKFLAGASPLEDYEWGERDRDAHQRLLRGTRGKITINNERVFLGSGQSFIISLTILLLRLAVIPVLDCFMNKSNVFLRVVCFTYQLILGVFFYQYQIICVAEIAMMDYERIPASDAVAGLLASLFLSITVLILMVVEIFTKLRITRNIKKINNKLKKIKAITDETSMSMNNKFTLDRLTRTLNLDESSNQSYYKIPALETLRFFVIQILIATLQLLTRPRLSWSSL